MHAPAPGTPTITISSNASQRGLWQQHPALSIKVPLLPSHQPSRHPQQATPTTTTRLKPSSTPPTTSPPPSPSPPPSKPLSIKPLNSLNPPHQPKKPTPIPTRAAISTFATIARTPPTPPYRRLCKLSLISPPGDSHPPRDNAKPTFLAGHARSVGISLILGWLLVWVVGGLGGGSGCNYVKSVWYCSRWKVRVCCASCSLVAKLVFVVHHVHQ